MAEVPLTTYDIVRIRSRADTYERRVELMHPNIGAKMVIFDKRSPREAYRQIRAWCDKKEAELA